MVAPRAGAWIETPKRSLRATPRPSRPSRRGVDRNTAGIMFYGGDIVAPRAGAGIETPTPNRLDRAPRRSPLAQGRGSKRFYHGEHHRQQLSPLAQGRGSKLFEGNWGNN